jgi:hypothetical protein
MVMGKVEKSSGVAGVKNGNERAADWKGEEDIV